MGVVSYVLFLYWNLNSGVDYLKSQGKSETDARFQKDKKYRPRFDGKIFDQVDGIAMGSPLGPALANLFMGYDEQKWLESDHCRLAKFYRRYVDDILCLFENEHQSLTFLDFLNSQHPSLNFNIEKEHMK